LVEIDTIPIEISHVAALKERIACQIEVKPGSGGRSVLKGSGVRRL
jgi:exonuclease SbcC